MREATINDAPAALNINDRAMWVLGFNAARLSDQQIKAGLDASRAVEFTFDHDDGSTATEREAARIRAFRFAVEIGKSQPHQAAA